MSENFMSLLITFGFFALIGVWVPLLKALQPWLRHLTNRRKAARSARVFHHQFPASEVRQ